MQNGKFITLEGIDGAGKSTHLAWLEDYLCSKGVKVVVTREPGGTAVGEQLRALLLDQRHTMHAETEALLMFAARREHLDKIILPAIQRGDWVVSDRFSDASFAYQGCGRGVAWEKLVLLEQWVQEDFYPDLTVYIDVPVMLGRERVNSVKAADRFESETDAFFDRVRTGYLERVRQFPQRMQILDGSLPLDEVRAALAGVMEHFWLNQALHEK